MADLRTLVRRLTDVNCAPTSDSPEAVADCIKSHRIAGACCARDPMPDGRVQTFASYYTLCFGVDLDGKVPKPKKAAK